MYTKKTQSAQYVKNWLNILRLIEEECSMSVQLLLKGRAEPLKGTRLSVRLIESRYCVVCSMAYTKLSPYSYCSSMVYGAIEHTFFLDFSQPWLLLTKYENVYEVLARIVKTTKDSVAGFSFMIATKTILFLQHE